MSLGAPHTGGPARCEVRHFADAGMVRATLSGALDLEAFVRCAAAALAAASRHDTPRMMLDQREVRSNLTAADIYAMPARAAAHGLTPRHRIALLYAPRTLAPMDMLLWENVFVNRGYRARAFVDEDQALQWLACE